MDRSAANARLSVTLIFCCIFAFSAVIFFPNYVTNPQSLGMLVFAEVVIGAIWGYRKRFFPFLIVVFFFAGTGVPPLEFWQMARWFVLGAGALAGMISCLGDRRFSFRKFHFFAFLCVIAAALSASASSYTIDSLFKVLGLFLMFLYAASGIRVGAAGRELKFSFALLTFCEILIYVTASCYFILHYDFFGNPNSLGAVMGVLVAPMMLWGVFASERTPAHERRMLALMLCILLLVTSHARAGMLAAGFSFVLMCITLRRYRALAMVVGTALLAAVIVAFAFPTVTDQHDAGQSLASDFVYKGHPELGILGSRETIWEKTMSSVREHPWLGTGFGTSATGIDVSNDFSSFRSSARSTREHGNSYLATLEWVGIIGVGPFVILVFLIAVNVGRLLVRIRHSGNALSPLVPLVGVVLAGLVNAAFEDWLFAAGYYLCVLFWGLAFVLDDFVYISDQLAAS